MMMNDFLESEEFYYAMQGYRNSDERNQRNVCNEYENVKSLISAKCSAGWRPIDTAPKDGTLFLGFRDGRARETYKIQRDDCEMWCFGGVSGSADRFPEIKPTHWMPLPDAPKGEE